MSHPPEMARMRELDTRALFAVTALAEGGTGLALVSVPGVVMFLLLGARRVSPEALLVGRLAGAALLCIGIASWSAREDKGTHAAIGLLAGLLVYNAAAAALLGLAGTVSGLAGIALWPAAVFHAAMAAWCLAARSRRPRAQDPPGGVDDGDAL